LIQDFFVRPAHADDALCLSVLAMQVFLDTYAAQGIRPQIAREVMASCSEASFHRTLSESGTRIDVAEVNGHLIGFAEVTLSASHDLAPSGLQAELLRLYVQEPFTGARVGTALLRQAEQHASDAGSTVLWLTSWVHNHRALAFYARRGYTDHGLTQFNFEGETHLNKVLAKKLSLQE
jgi:GNAT superfamily N-acetyltransferase